MRIKVTRDSVIDKLHPLEKSPQHKKIPAALRTKTPDKIRRADHVISPRQRKNSFVSPKQAAAAASSGGKRRSKVRAVNLAKLFDSDTTKNVGKKERKQRSLEQCEGVKKKEERSMEEEQGESVEEPAPVLPVHPEFSVSLVSTKTEVPDNRVANQMELPPPVKIRRGWKKHIPRGLGYRLFGPDSPAKPPSSPATLAVKLCFLGRISEPSIRPEPGAVVNKDASVGSSERALTRRPSLQLIR